MSTDEGRERFEIEGKWFYVPSPVLVVHEGDRLAAAFYSGGVTRVHGDWLTYSLEPDACDFSMVRSGRAPVLVEHMRCVDALLGMILSAELDGGVLRSVARFGPGKESDRLWGMLAAGFPLSLSLGATIQHAVREEKDGPDGMPAYHVTRWRLEELSVVVWGKDESAHVRLLGRDESPAAMVERMNSADSDPAKAEAARALQLDRWRRWALPAGIWIANELGSAPTDLCVALDREVRTQCSDLERDFAL
jgi:hypothetical protein